MRRLGVALLVGAWACGGENATLDGDAGEGQPGVGADESGAGATPGSDLPAGGGGDLPAGSSEQAANGCGASLVESPPSSFAHQTQCAEIAYETDPPSGGPHYAVWPAYQTYDFPIEAGFLVHALEHGAVVFWYNCPEGCAEEVAEVQGFIDALPEDPSCAGTGAARRVVLVPSPTLGSRWAASAWGYALTADCFDPEVFGEFYSERYGRGREDLCNSGPVFTENPCP